LLPSSAGRPGRPFRDDRRVVEGIIYRFRCGLPWRDVPAVSIDSTITRVRQHGATRARTQGARSNYKNLWRGLATRYDKLAMTFRSGAVLRAIVTWLRALGDTP
jgi:transposase